MTQTLSTGLTTVQKYELDWAVGGQSVPSEPLSGTFAILKQRGAGGSHFFQSIPGALTLNFDPTPIVHHPHRGFIWPFCINNTLLEMDPRYPGDLGKAKPVSMTWESVIAKKQMLVDMAKAGRGRPSAVLIDTFDSCLDLIKKYITSANKVDVFGDLGIRGWELAYREFWDNLYWPLLWAGYPIGIGIQIYNEPVYQSGMSQGPPPTPRPNWPLISEKAMAYLCARCNMVGRIERYEKAGEVTTLPGGQKKYGTGGLARRIVFYDPACTDMKVRGGVPTTLELPAHDPWKTYATAFAEAAKRDIESATTLPTSPTEK